MDYQHIQVSRSGGITRILLNRPEVLNAINQRMHDELQHAFDTFAADADQRIAVIRGAGERAFSAGSDLKAIAAARQPNVYPASGYAGLINRFDLDKPLIAAVDGVAVGGGFEVALACDILIATHRSRFGLPEPRVGAVALGGGIHRLARQIGMKQAMGLVLTAELVDAKRGFQLGFVNELVEPDQLESTVERWCDGILACAPLAVSASKQALLRGLDEPSLEAAMVNQATYPAFATWQTSDDRHEGAHAFAEKRPPNWRGR
ncbi:MAG: enoyl-CoA hydratase-related protein [Pseudomonadota bacterium]